MITAIRLEGAGESPAEIQQEFDALLAHVKMAGYLEGIVPPLSDVPKGGEVYPRTHHSEPVVIDGRQFHFEFTGRKVLHFEPLNHDTQHPLPQSEYEVFEREGYVGDHGEYPPMGASTGQQVQFSTTRRDMQPDVIVLRRLLPMSWPDRQGPTMESSSPPKPTPVDLAAFTQVMLREEVNEGSYSMADGGFDVHLTCLVPTGSDTAYGWGSTLHGETLREASEAAVAEIDAKVAEFTETGSLTLG